MAGCWTRIASTSAGATWKALTLISSLSRSTTTTWPAVSTWPRSPVRTHPSGVIMSAVSSGRWRYPSIVCGPRAWSSPSMPGSEFCSGGGVDDAQFGVRQQRADGARCGAGWSGGDADRPAGFGESPSLADGAVGESVGEGLVGGGGEWRSAAGDQFETGEVVCRRRWGDGRGSWPSAAARRDR